MNILFIDDEPETVEPATLEVSERVEDARVEIEHSFDRAVELINSFKPDIVVLDLLRASPTGELIDDGLGPLEIIWESRFGPVIVYSAEPERVRLQLPKIAAHPLVRLIQKGQGSETEIVDSLRELRVHVEVLDEIMDSMQSEARIALREVAPVVWDNQAMVKDIRVTVERASKRRLAASFDLALDTDSKMHPWEQYVFPPLGSDPMLGDLLRTHGTDWDNPSAYRVVLTPSCDLVSSEHRPPKVERVLLARCISWEDGLSSLNLRNAKVQTIRNRLPSLLNRGFQEAAIPLPGLKHVIPTMLVDVRALELAPIDHIGIGSDCKFQRVASLDSPFRELVSWAYLQTAGRPGLPDRDVDSWVSDVEERVQRPED